MDKYNGGTVDCIAAAASVGTSVAWHPLLACHTTSVSITYKPGVSMVFPEWLCLFVQVYQRRLQQ